LLKQIKDLEIMWQGLVGKQVPLAHLFL
jgi:hypothetical protein